MIFEKFGSCVAIHKYNIIKFLIHSNQLLTGSGGNAPHHYPNPGGYGGHEYRGDYRRSGGGYRGHFR